LRSVGIRPSDTALSEEILFVLGAARSGTTFLNGFLFRWFDYGTGPEGQFVIDYFRRAARYQPLKDSENRRNFIEAIAACEMLEIIRNRWPKDISFDVTPEQIEQETREPTYAGIVHAVFSCVAKGQNKHRIGNKFPGYWRHLDLLDTLFPSKSKYLCIVRDGRDVALSAMRTRWGERNAYTSAKEWADCVSTIIDFRARIGQDRVLLIRYEDLLTDPEMTVSQISEFLSVELTDEERRGAIEEALQSASKHALYKWRSSMSRRDRIRFEAAAAAQLSLMSYDLEFTAADISTTERVFLTTAELIHKVRRTLIGS